MEDVKLDVPYLERNLNTAGDSVDDTGDARTDGIEVWVKTINSKAKRKKAKQKTESEEEPESEPKAKAKSKSEQRIVYIRCDINLIRKRRGKNWKVSGTARRCCWVYLNPARWNHRIDPGDIMYLNSLSGPGLAAYKELFPDAEIEVQLVMYDVCVYVCTKYFKRGKHSKPEEQKFYHRLLLNFMQPWEQEGLKILVDVAQGNFHYGEITVTEQEQKRAKAQLESLGRRSLLPRKNVLKQLGQGANSNVSAEYKKWYRQHCDRTVLCVMTELLSHMQEIIGLKIEKTGRFPHHRIATA
ncbi:MAG: hypothetical protein LUD50_04785 [Clostridia bacterium]|nr:hypothetical protein [Clostridia bacterium]